MTLQELRYLVAVAAEENFARAAELCHVGQSTLSTQLRKLEESLGVPLFDRSHRHATPTPIGQQIIEQARITLEHAERIREIANSGLDPMASPLRLGAFPTLGPYLIPHVLPTLIDTYPKLRLFLKESLTGKLLEDLSSGQLDAALLALPIDKPGLDAAELFNEPFVVALPPGHPLTEHEQVHERDLEDHCVLLLEEGHCLRQHALDICGSSMHARREEFKASSLETLRQMVAVGIGCTLLPALAAAPHVGSLQPDLIEIRPFAPPVPTRTIGLVWRHGCPRVDLFNAIADHIRDHLPASVESLRTH